jgi:hypothetical protein
MMQGSQLDQNPGKSIFGVFWFRDWVKKWQIA